MIYFVQADLVGRIKIGFTSASRFGRRIAALQTASPVPLHVLACTDGGRRREKALHVRFDEYRVHGEWFFPGDRLIRYIARLQGKLARTRPKRPSRVQRAAEWLIGLFAEKAEWPSDELFRAAREANISRNAVLEARHHLGLPRPKRRTIPSGSTCWLWWVPAGWTPVSGQEMTS